MNSASRGPRWKRLAAGAAVASFVLGCLAATALESAAGLRGADLHSSKPLPGDQISLQGRNSKWCLAVEDHNNVQDGTKLQLYECSHPVGQTFQVEKNKDGSMMAAPTSPPTDAPPNPCGKPCTEDKDCNGNGGFFGNTCLVGGTRCAGHCAKRD